MHLSVCRARFAFGLLLLIGISWSLDVHAETYRWVDENGNVHFSDQPHASAEGASTTPEIVDENASGRYRINSDTGFVARTPQSFALESVTMDLKDLQADFGTCELNDQTHVVTLEQVKEAMDVRALKKNFYERLNDQLPHRLLQEIGLRPPFPGSDENRYVNSGEIPDLRLVAVIESVKFGNCARSTIVTVRWTMLDDRNPDFHITTTTYGVRRDLQAGYPTRSHMLAEAFGEAAFRLPSSFPPRTSFAKASSAPDTQQSAVPRTISKQSRVIRFGSIEMNLPYEPHGQYGEDCTTYGNISRSEIESDWKKIKFEKIVYDVLEHEGYLTAKEDALKSVVPPLRLTGVAEGIRFWTCGYVVEIKMHWYVFDPRQQKIVFETRTRINEVTPTAKRGFITQGDPFDIMSVAVRKDLERLIAEKEFLTLFATDS